MPAQQASQSREGGELKEDGSKAEEKKNSQQQQQQQPKLNTLDDHAQAYGVEKPHIEPTKPKEARQPAAKGNTRSSAAPRRQQHGKQKQKDDKEGNAAAEESSTASKKGKDPVEAKEVGGLILPELAALVQWAADEDEKKRPATADTGDGGKPPQTPKRRPGTSDTAAGRSGGKHQASTTPRRLVIGTYGSATPASGRRPRTATSSTTATPQEASPRRHVAPASPMRCTLRSGLAMRNHAMCPKCLAEDIPPPPPSKNKENEEERETEEGTTREQKKDDDMDDVNQNQQEGEDQSPARKQHAADKKWRCSQCGTKSRDDCQCKRCESCDDLPWFCNCNHCFQCDRPYKNRLQLDQDALAEVNSTKPSVGAKKKAAQSPSKKKKKSSNKKGSEVDNDNDAQKEDGEESTDNKRDNNGEGALVVVAEDEEEDGTEQEAAERSAAFRSLPPPKVSAAPKGVPFCKNIDKGAVYRLGKPSLYPSNRVLEWHVPEHHTVVPGGWKKKKQPQPKKATIQGGKWYTFESLATPGLSVALAGKGASSTQGTHLVLSPEEPTPFYAREVVDGSFMFMPCSPEVDAESCISAVGIDHICTLDKTSSSWVVKYKRNIEVIEKVDDDNHDDDGQGEDRSGEATEAQTATASQDPDLETEQGKSRRQKQEVEHHQKNDDQKRKERKRATPPEKKKKVSGVSLHYYGGRLDVGPSPAPFSNIFLTEDPSAAKDEEANNNVEKKKGESHKKSVKDGEEEAFSLSDLFAFTEVPNPEEDEGDGEGENGDNSGKKKSQYNKNAENLPRAGRRYYIEPAHAPGMTLHPNGGASAQGTVVVLEGQAAWNLSCQWEVLGKHRNDPVFSFAPVNGTQGDPKTLNTADSTGGLGLCQLWNYTDTGVDRPVQQWTLSAAPGLYGQHGYFSIHPHLVQKEEEQQQQQEGDDERKKNEENQKQETRQTNGASQSSSSSPPPMGSNVLGLRLGDARIEAELVINRFQGKRSQYFRFVEVKGGGGHQQRKSTTATISPTTTTSQSGGSRWSRRNTRMSMGGAPSNNSSSEPASPTSPASQSPPRLRSFSRVSIDNGSILLNGSSRLEDGRDYYVLASPQPPPSENQKQEENTAKEGGSEEESRDGRAEEGATTTTSSTTAAGNTESADQQQQGASASPFSKTRRPVALTAQGTKAGVDVSFTPFKQGSLRQTWKIHQLCDGSVFVLSPMIAQTTVLGSDFTLVSEAKANRAAAQWEMHKVLIEVMPPPPASSEPPQQEKKKKQQQTSSSKDESSVVGGEKEAGKDHSEETAASTSNNSSSSPTKAKRTTASVLNSQKKSYYQLMRPNDTEGTAVCMQTSSPPEGKQQQEQDQEEEDLPPILAKVGSDGPVQPHLYVEQPPPKKKKTTTAATSSRSSTQQKKTKSSSAAGAQSSSPPRDRQQQQQGCRPLPTPSYRVLVEDTNEGEFVKLPPADLAGLVFSFVEA